MATSRSFIAAAGQGRGEQGRVRQGKGRARRGVVEQGRAARLMIVILSVMTRDLFGPMGKNIPWK